MSPVNTPVWNSSHLHHRSRVQLLSHLPTLQFLSSPHSALTQAPSMGRGNQQRSVLTTALLLILIEMTQADSVTQSSHPIVLKQRESTTIQCAYETAATARGFFWYIQDPNQAPQLILNEYSQAEDIPPRFQNRFSASHEKTEKTFHLNITAAVLSDSATYFCALRPTL
ncbi:UNVERIFIED_CONTAM: hypothetical protein FKN15_031392 [Acipenser sinensis]